MSRIGPGEWQFDVRQEIVAYSNEFITSIRTVAPKLLEDLSRAPFHSFHDAQLDSMEMPELSRVWNELIHYETTMGDERFLKYSMLKDPLLCAFRKDLWDWSERWHLTADWCRQWAFETLYVWGRVEGRRERLVPMRLRVVYNRAGPDPSPPNALPHWHTGIQTKEDYLHDVREQVKERAQEVIQSDPLLSLGEASRRNAFIDSIVDRAREYCNEVEKHIEEHEPDAKRVAFAHSLQDHMAWTVRVWVLNENFSQVARSVKKTRPAVRKAVLQILSIIEPSWLPELEIRFPAGRPKET